MKKKTEGNYKQNGGSLFDKKKSLLTSAVKYSRIAAEYTAAVAPTRPWLVVRFFKCLCILPTGNCNKI